MALRDKRGSTRGYSGAARWGGWHPLGQVLHPPPTLRGWLLERGSLTRRLQDHFGNIDVWVLQQHTGLAIRDEGPGHAVPVILRNVVLCSSNQTVRVVAHSILPLRPRGALSLMLKRLGRQALGSVLFRRPGFVRYQREWAWLDRRHPLYQLALTQVDDLAAQGVWARRAVFSMVRNPGQTVQVTEIFCTV